MEKVVAAQQQSETAPAPAAVAEESVKTAEPIKIN